MPTPVSSNGRTEDFGSSDEGFDSSNRYHASVAQLVGFLAFNQA